MHGNPYLLVALVQIRGGKAIVADLNRFLVHADSLARQRNRFVHDPWISSGGNPRRVEITADRTLRFEAIETTLPSMDKLWREIADAISTLETLYTRIKNELPPWPDKLYLQSRDKDPTRAHINRDIGP